MTKKDLQYCKEVIEICDTFGFDFIVKSTAKK
jgi:hypothetical protein